MEEPKFFGVWCCTLLSSTSPMFSSYLLPCHPSLWEIINNIQIFHITVSKMPSGVPLIRRCRVLYGPIWIVLGTWTGHWDCKRCLTNMTIWGDWKSAPRCHILSLVTSAILTGHEMRNWGPNWCPNWCPTRYTLHICSYIMKIWKISKLIYLIVPD